MPSAHDNPLRLSLLVVALSLAVGAPGAAHAQDRPFLFSISTAADPSKPALRFDYDIGGGERAFQSDTGNQPEVRVGVQATRGRFTFVARFGVAEVGSAYQSSQSGEVLVSLFRPSAGSALSAGGGVTHEAGGTDVLLARFVAARKTERWRAQGNVLVQKPLDANRDALDLITTVGWSANITRSLSLGVEGVGEDLEGFWSPEEAEGGARLLVGPSMHVAPPGRRWQLTATGGPTFHPDNTGRVSDALRDLPAATRRVGYAARVGLTFAVF